MWMEGPDFLCLPKTHLQLGSEEEEQEESRKKKMAIRADQQKESLCITR